MESLKYMELEKEVSLNEGTIVAIAGDDFVVIAADTQIHSNDFIPMCRQDKIFKVSPLVVMSCTGSWPDTCAVIRLMRTTVSDYEGTHRRPMSIDAMSQMLSNNMYKSRSSPYSISTILAGIDKEGKGVVLSFDSLGHYEQMNYQSVGTASAMVLPILDSHLGPKNQSQETPTERIEVSEAVSIVSSCMVIAGEHDSYSSDSWLLKIINNDGIEVRKPPLHQE
ncbi:proteasome subunit beta type-1-like [Drosophila serrata]|uniref:proteasome subunit beta type-1-like n=1 Tax=Drosophila serrata TaxID=7274 RepID=UPI000A1D23EF|nr:proteasome subunit beta type-1-like [Drosophila serrata]